MIWVLLYRSANPRYVDREFRVYPFEDPVAIVCNEEGKINGMPLNRALRDESGKVYDVLSGTFFICGLTDDSFGSLSPEMMQKYEKFFHYPEVFMRMGNELRSFMVPDREPKDKDAAEKAKAFKQKKDSRDVL